MPEIDYIQNTNFGHGLNTLSRTPKGVAIEWSGLESIGSSIAASTNKNSPVDQKISRIVKVVSSREEVSNSLDVSLSASVGIGNFGLDAKSKLISNMKFESNSIFFLVRISIENPTLMICNPKIKPEAIKLLNSRGVKAFRERYGNSYISGITTGGEYFAILEFQSKKQQNHREIQNDFRVNFPFSVSSGSVGFKHGSNTSRIEENYNIVIISYRSGGEGINSPLSLESVINEMDEFVRLSNQYNMPYKAHLSEYDALDIPYINGNISGDINYQYEKIQNISSTILAYQDQYKELEKFLYNHRAKLDGTQKQEIDAKLFEISQEIDKLTKQAQKCIYQGSLEILNTEFSLKNFRPNWLKGFEEQ